MRETILSEIRRIAADDGGKPPGVILFARQTGIRESDWKGVYWARWSDAVRDAGFEANDWNSPLEKADMLRRLAECIRVHKAMPTNAEINLYRREHPDFPQNKTFRRRFGDKAAIAEALNVWLNEHPDYADILPMLPEVKSRQPLEGTAVKPLEGFVYLLRSGQHYKIGRSEEIERRVKEIRVALPESAILDHVIRTDDPSGIEAYWHNRFRDKRANGEWFSLTPADVAAFKRRKFQ